MGVRGGVYPRTMKENDCSYLTCERCRYACSHHYTWETVGTNHQQCRDLLYLDNINRHNCQTHFRKLSDLLSASINPMEAPYLLYSSLRPFIYILYLLYLSGFLKISTRVLLANFFRNFDYYMGRIIWISLVIMAFLFSSLLMGFVMLLGHTHIFISAYLLAFEGFKHFDYIVITDPYLWSL